MSKLTVQQIRNRFQFSTEFNEIFDSFGHALEQRLDDIEMYLPLFWNHSLTPDELCLFGEKLTKEFPALAYDVYLWLANVFEVTYSMIDNHELSFHYYKKSAAARPNSPEPYLNAANSYEPDLNIPPLNTLIEFLKEGVRHVEEPKIFYERLVQFYEMSGNDEMSSYYRRLGKEGPVTPQEPI